MYYLWRMLLLLSLLASSMSSSGADLVQQRNNFLLAEKLIEGHNDEAFFEILETLTDYPLYPVLQYQWLKNNLAQTEKILNFLTTYKDSRHAALLRGKWLAYLAEQQRWPEIVQNYQPDDDQSTSCQYYWALYKNGDTQQALDEAKKLWLTGTALPDSCDALLSALLLSPLGTPELIWRRFELALQNDNIRLADYVRRLMSESNRELAQLWLDVHKQPALIENNLFWQRNDPIVLRIFADGVLQMAKDNLEQAVFLWDRDKHSFALDPAVDREMERKLAIKLAFKRHYSAYERLAKLLEHNEESREWRVRAALLEQNWSHISDALAGLTDSEKQTPRWQYWIARALAKAGDMVQAEAIYTKLASDRSFHGFMAADMLNKPYLLTDRPVPLTVTDLNNLEALPDFKLIPELIALDRMVEARRQWNYATKKLAKPQLMVAAKLAQRWGWQQIAIFTLAKTDYWDDLGLRFPVNYIDPIAANAYRNNLEPALVFGLIRQESVFDKDAQSEVGAKGLMQLMPKTAVQVARDMGEPWQVENSLLNPETNIKYGTFYYRQLLNRYHGQFAPATAAYNAGPQNVQKWLPLIGTVPADIWIETIPFKETRKYVGSVLSYAIIYQHRIQRGMFKLKNLLPDVQPG